MAAVGICALANVALVLHDAHLDLTREKVYTPSAAAMRVVDELDREVSLTYFYHSQDPAGQRSRDILRVLERRNPLLQVRAVDPDKEPTLARTGGIRIYNAAMIEAEGRRVLVQSTDETEIALGIQRVLRRAGHYDLLHRGPRRAADGQFRVSYASGGRSRTTAMATLIEER